MRLDRQTSAVEAMGCVVMLRQTKVAVSFVLVAFALMMEGTPGANAGSKLPDPIKAGVADRLFRLDCGRSLAKRRTQYRILVYLLAYKAWKRMVALGYGCS